MTNKADQDLSAHLQKLTEYGDIIRSLTNKYSFTNRSFLKRIISCIFYLGSETQLMVKISVPLTFWGMGLLGSKPCAWIKDHLKFDVGRIWNPLLNVIIFFVKHIGYIRSYYWASWLAYYLEKDTNFNSTLKKMSNNSLIPYDMLEFYRILVYSNDDRFEFVKNTVISIGIRDIYRERQIRNGMVPQF